MGLFQPAAPPYDPLEWVKLPFAERARHGVRGLGAAGLRHAARRSTSSTRSRSRFYVGGVDRSSAASRPGWAACATIGAWWLDADRVPEGDPVEHAVRGARARAAAAARSPAATSRRSAASCTSCARAPPSCRCSRALPLLGGTRRTLARRRALRSRCVALARARAASRRRSARAQLLADRRAACRCSASLDKTLFLARAASTTGRRSLCFALRRQLDRRREGRAARALVLGRLLEAQPPLPGGGVRDDEQQPVHALRVAAARACTASYPDDLRPSRLAAVDGATPAPRSSSRVPIVLAAVAAAAGR